MKDKLNKILEKLKQKDTLKKTLPLVLILLLVTIVIGVTYAVITYTSSGGINTITTGVISMSYTESTNVISITNALPKSDVVGKVQEEYFDFSVTSNMTTENEQLVSYEIDIEPLSVDDGYTALTDSQIKVYLENISTNTEVLDSTLISNLSTSTLNTNYKVLYANSHTHSNEVESITTSYRLRAWIDYNVDSSNWTAETKQQYKFRVNINTSDAVIQTGTTQECFEYTLDDSTMTATITDYLCSEETVTTSSYTTKEYYIKPLTTALEDYPIITDVEIPEVILSTSNNYVYYIDPANYENEEMVSQCTANIIAMEDSELSEEEVQTLCSGGELNGLTLNYFAAVAPESIEELGLEEIGMAEKVGSITYTLVENPSDEAISNCTATFVSLGETEGDAQTICTGEEVEGMTLEEAIADPDVGLIYGALLSNTGMVNAKTTPYKGETIQSYTVTAIGEKAFYNKNLTSITLSDKIVSIGAGAFTGNKLPEEEAYFYARTDSNSDGIAEIDYTTLVSYGGTGENVIIPESVTSIEMYAYDYSKLSNDLILKAEEIRTCFTYTTSDSSATITDWTCTDLYNPVIPNAIDGYDVITIGSEAFSDNNLTSIIIPDSVTTIGFGAFEYNNLTSVVIPDSVTTIREFAFNSNQLTNIVIPDSVISISPWGTFSNNKLPEEQAYIYARTDSDSDGVAEIDYSTIIGYGGENKNITIPSTKNEVTLTTINAYAFYANGLISAVIPNGVKTINTGAFSYNQLTSITIPDSVTTIATYTFTSNQLPEDQAYIYKRTDTNNDGIAEIDYTTIVSYGGASKNITIPSTKNGVNLTTIESSSFEKNSLISIVIPNTVTTIGNYAFMGNDLTSLTIPDSVTSIGNNGFSLNDLTSITIPSSVNSIGNSAFASNKLTSVKIKGKSSSSDFTTYGTDIWGWADGYSDDNITWNYTE